MQLEVYSYDGHVLNSTDFEAWITSDQFPTANEQGPIYVQRFGTWPYLAGSEFPSHSFNIQVTCLGTIHSQKDTLRGWFDVFDGTPHQLIVKDTADTDRQWYLYCIPTQITGSVDDPATYTIQLASQEPVWRTVTSSTDTWAVTATGQTKTLTIVGNQPAKPIFYITPTSAGSNTYAYIRWIPIYSQATAALVSYPIEVTNGGIDTSALVGAGKMSSDGADLRIWYDGLETPRWVDGMDTTDTAVWINGNWSIPISLTVDGVIESSDTPTEITFKATTTNRNSLSTLAIRPNKVLLIDSEAFMYTSVSPALYKVTGVTRAQKFTSAADHADAVVAHHIEHDIYMLYGSTSATLPSTDMTYEPMINMTTSTNVAWNWADYYDSDYPNRSAQWKPQVIASTGKQSTYYTANQNTSANPASEMGMIAKAYLQTNIWRAETANIAWSLTQPCGVITCSCTGEKYKYATSWPTLAGLQKSANGSVWTAQWNEAAPVSTDVQTWVAFNRNASSDYTLGSTYKYVRFNFSGSIAAAANNYSAMEVDALAVTMNSSDAPVVSIGAENSNYQILATITNSTTGDSFSLAWPMDLNTTLTVDCNAKTVTDADGGNALAGLTLSSVRSDWLNLIPSTNELLYTEAGVSAVTIGIHWENRSL